MNSLNPESEALRAGQIMLDWMRELADRKRDFAFETTLAAGTYAPWLKGLRQSGYEVYLYYYWLDSAELALARVAERVRAGGHHIPDRDVLRRYGRSAKNFLELYRPIADYWEVMDNSFGQRELIAIGNPSDEVIGDPDIWSQFLRSAEYA